MQASQHFCFIPLSWEASLLSSDEMILEYQQFFLDSVLPGFSCESSRSQKRTKTALLNSGIHLLYTLLTALKVLNFNISQSLQPKLSLCFTFPTQSLLAGENKVSHYTSSLPLGSYHQHSPGTSCMVYALLCCPFKW